MTVLIQGTQSSSAQTGPGNCAVDTLVGNGGSGLTCLGFQTTLNIMATFGWNDQSASIGQSSFWFNFQNGQFLTNRFNKLQVGEESLDGASCPQTPQSWLLTAINQTCEGSQLAVTSTTGLVGVEGAARTSDERTLLGAASEGTEGVFGIGLNDDTGSGGPISVGGLFQSINNSGVTGTSLATQNDVSNANTAQIPDPAHTLGSGSGMTIAGLFTSGDLAMASTNVGAGIVLQQGKGSGPVFEKGILFSTSALDGAIGTFGGGIAMEMTKLQEIRWYDGSTVWAELSGTSGGLSIAATNGISINGTAGVSCTGSPSGSFATIDGLVTHC